MLDLENVYVNIDKMHEMKRYRGPTPGYFPTVGEINTFARDKDKHPHMIAYLAWLEDSLSTEERKEHKEAIDAFKKIIDEMNGPVD